MERFADLAAAGIKGAGFTVLERPAEADGRSVVAMSSAGQTWEISADSDLDAVIELSRRVLLGDLGQSTAPETPAVAPPRPAN